MGSDNWTVTLKVYRQKGETPPHYDRFTLVVDPDEYILDAVERVWAFHDRSLTFRHACHHSTCGACGIRVNGLEKLTCITPIRSVTHDGGMLTLEPLRNFMVISDLVVDMTAFYALMEAARYPQVVRVADAPLGDTIRPLGSTAEPGMMRLNDCIECGMCISACPIATTTAGYLGPAVLAGAQFSGLQNEPSLAELVDNQDGAWRCHSIYECSAVCPSSVEPAWRIMDLRRQVIATRFHHLFHPGGS